MYEKLSEEIRAIIKEECQNVFKDVSGNLAKTISDNYLELNTQLAGLNDKQEKTTIQLDELNKIVNTDKAFVDRIQDLLNFQKRANDQINSHELRIGNVSKGLKDACYKYDRIYLDNLCIPGVIGEFCRFKTVKDYLEHNMSQMQSLNVFREKHVLELTTYKEKLDGMIKSFSAQMESFDKNMKLHMKQLIDNSDKSIRHDMNTLSHRIGELRLENNYSRLIKCVKI